MTARVNLLPKEDLSARAARRTMHTTVGLVLLFVVALGGLYALKTSELQQAQEEQMTAQADVSQLEAEVAQLEQFRVLADELEARNALLASAMGQEISFARVLNDLSLAFPAGSSLRTLSVGVQAPAAPEAVAFGETVAAVSYDGYSVERFAPGVETVIVEFDKVRSFFNSSIATAAVEEIGSTEVIGFVGNAQLGSDAFTGRYADGLPEGGAR